MDWTLRLAAHIVKSRSGVGSDVPKPDGGLSSLFAPQRRIRVDPRGAQRRPEGGEQRYGGQQCRHADKSRRIGSTDIVELARHQPSQGKCTDQSDEHTSDLERHP